MATPLADAIKRWVDDELARASSPPLLMLSGAQGIGKSSAMAALASRKDVQITVLGLDDFYKTLGERKALATGIHPLCETRGPPGTHDLGLLRDVVEDLLHGSPARRVRVPHFDKRSDERVSRQDWRELATRPDAILIEGWLMGALPDLQAAVSASVNALEANEDPDGVWRGWQEDALAGAYAELWKRADGFLHLRAPSFESVHRWRCQQEETTLGLEPGTLPQERREWVGRFIQHYERITRRMLEGHVRKGMTIQVDELRGLVQAS